MGPHCSHFMFSTFFSKNGYLYLTCLSGKWMNSYLRWQHKTRTIPNVLLMLELLFSYNYADDMKCYRIITDHSDERQLRSDLSSLNSWSSDHFMNFNIKECISTLLLQRERISYRCHTIWMDCKLHYVTTEKELGVHISSTLSWNGHIDLILGHRTCTNECDQLTLLTLSKSLVHPQ